MLSEGNGVFLWQSDFLYHPKIDGLDIGWKNYDLGVETPKHRYSTTWLIGTWFPGVGFGGGGVRCHTRTPFSS